MPGRLRTAAAANQGRRAAAITPKPVLVDTPEQLIAAGDMSNTGFETNHRRAHEILSRFTEKQWAVAWKTPKSCGKLVGFVRDRELTGTDFGTISRFHWGVIHSRLLSLGQVKALIPPNPARGMLSQVFLGAVGAPTCPLRSGVQFVCHCFEPRAGIIPRAGVSERLGCSLWRHADEAVHGARRAGSVANCAASTCRGPRSELCRACR